MSDFLWFRWMLTPRLIIWLWWAVTALSFLVGWGMMLGTTGGVLTGLAVIVGVPLVSRLVCELVIVQFAIHANLSDMRAALLRQEEVREREPSHAAVP